MSWAGVDGAAPDTVPSPVHMRCLRRYTRWGVHPCRLVSGFSVPIVAVCFGSVPVPSTSSAAGVLLAAADTPKDCVRVFAGGEWDQVASVDTVGGAGAPSALACSQGADPLVAVGFASGCLSVSSLWAPGNPKFQVCCFGLPFVAFDSF